MINRSIYLSIGILFIFTITISACGLGDRESSATATGPVLESTTPTEVIESTPYPQPSERVSDDVNGTDQAGYPPPGAGLPAPSATVSGPYPGPGDIEDTREFSTVETSRSTTLTTTSNGYPGPETTTVGINVSQTPYPGPEESFQPTATLTPGTPIPTSVGGATTTPSPSPTSTPFDVSTRLAASDPDNFKLASGELQLVEFFAFWSPISKSMTPVLSRLENKYENNIRFIYLDIDDPANNLFATLMGDRLPPVFFLLSESGEVLHEWEGYVPFEQFDQDIANVRR